MMKLTLTLEQSIALSSGSVTVTLKGTAAPMSMMVPSVGSSRVTLGAVLPTVMITEAFAVFPVPSETVNSAV